MKLETHWHQVTKNEYIFIREWHVHNSKGVIHLIHGMMEHSGFYNDWAKELAKFGYSVIIHDHPASGLTVFNNCSNDHLPMNGREILVKATQLVDKWIREKYGDLKIIRYGHSMGAFVALAGHLNGINASGIIMTGLSFEQNIILRVQKVLLKILALINKQNSIANLAHFLTFYPFNRRFKKAGTRHDWISRNKKALGEYINDPLCGNIATWGYFFTLNELLLEINNNEKWKNSNDLPPTLIMSGEFDALSNFGKKVANRIKNKSSRFKDTTLHIIPESRHKVEYDQNQGIVLSNIDIFLQGINEQ